MSRKAPGGEFRRQFGAVAFKWQLTSWSNRPGGRIDVLAPAREEIRQAPAGLGIGLLLG